MKRKTRLPSVKGVRNPTTPERAMLERGLDYLDVARLAGFSPLSIREYCRRGCSSDSVGADLASILGVPIDWFCDGWRAEREQRNGVSRSTGLKLRLVK